MIIVLNPVILFLIIVGEMIYLDNAATSFPKAPGVAQSVSKFLTEIGANAGRASHSLARKSSSLIFNCRESLAELLGVVESERIIFTSNATEALNIAIIGMVKEGATVLTSFMEHNSVMRPLHFLEKTKGIKIIKFLSDSTGFPDIADFKEKLKIIPDLLVFTAASNVTGVISPFEEMASLAASEGITVCVDGAQLTGSYPVSLKNTQIDMFAFSGHKGLLGPTGTGGLYIRESVIPAPLFYGGTGSRSIEEVQPDFMPDKYESGTPNIAGISGLLESLNFLNQTGIEKVRKKENLLREMLISDLKGIPGLKLFNACGSIESTAVISLIHEEMSISEITLILDRKDIAVRMGLHCAPSAHRTIGTFDSGGTVRLSPGYFTTDEEIEETIKAFREMI